MSDGVFILGAGPVAITLAGALRLANVPVIGIWARRESAAKAAGKQAGVPHFSDAWPGEIRDATTLILAVRDDAIAPLAERLYAEDMLEGAPILLHCSGAQAATKTFANVPAAGRGLLHPLRAIIDPNTAIPAMAGTTFGIQGDDTGVAAAQELCEALGATTLALHAHQMPAYHTAAAILSNYVVSLADLAQEVLAHAKIEHPNTLAAFLDLARGALDNLESQGLPKGLTGPIRRGDREIIATHLHALEQGPRVSLDLYRLLAGRALALSHQIAEADELKLADIAGLLEPAEDVDR